MKMLFQDMECYLVFICKLNDVGNLKNQSFV